MKTRKTSLFKKVLSITLALTLIISGLVFVVPHAHGAVTVDYVYSGDKRTGIKTIKIDGKTYYDIYNGEEGLNVAPLRFYEDAITKEYDGYSISELWANIASLAFESGGTDYGFQDSGYSSNFDKWFTKDTDNNRDTNLIQDLAGVDKGHTDSHKHNRTRITSWSTATTLDTVQRTMAQEISDSFNDDSNKDVSTSDILEYSSGNKDGFTAMKDKTERQVLYNIVTSSYYNSGANKAYYSSFGLAFYDFEIVPFADDDMDFITAAEGYSDLETAAAENVPGVTYKPSSASNSNISYVTNPSASDSVVTATYNDTKSTTVSNYMESSETYSFSENISTSTEFSSGFPHVADTKVSVSVGFTAEQAITTAYGSESSLSSIVSAETAAEMTLPAHTQIGITQESGNSEIILDYDCPVYITYKVVAFAMNGEFYLGPQSSIDWKNLYDQGGMCVPFCVAGKESVTTGYNAVENAYNRAIVYEGASDFEKAYGDTEGFWEKQGDGNSHKRLYALDWSKILNQTQANGTGLTGKQCIERLYSYIPLSAAGGTMTIRSSSINTDISPIIPLYDLDYVYVDGGGVYTIAPGGSIDFSKVGTSGYNEHNISYYGYISDGGNWVLCNAAGEEQTSVSGVTLEDVSNYQKLTATEEGTYYAKFVIDETLYTKVSGNGYITNADLSSNPIVTIKVTSTGLDHICSEGSWITSIAATCTTTGEQVANCVTCNRPMYTQTVPKLEHIPVKLTTPATCQSEGKITEICGVCLGLIASETTPKLDHVEGEWVTTTEPTCVNVGEKQQSCVNCEMLLAVEEIPANGHSAGEWVTTVEASCEVNGEKLRYCTVCNGVIEAGIIDAHGHAPAWITVKEATCSAVGREEYVCTICKSVLETKEIDKLEHIPGKWEITQPSSCTQEGLKQQTCALCGALIGEAVVIPAHDHQTGDWVTILEPGCETEGERIKSCTICNGTIESEAIPALGHTEGVWVTALEATCETQGEQHKSCTRCGKLIESKRIDALGHVPGPAMTCVTDQVCLVCEEVLVPADGRSHVWTEWATYKAASFFVEEQQRRECSSCYLEEYRFVKGTSGCHKYFPHCDGSGEDCWACETLSNTNGFFRNLGKFLTWFFFENLITNILFPFSHEHFHEMINLDQIFGS